MTTAFLAGFLVSPSARAEDPAGGDSRAEADEEFNLGKKLMDEGHVSPACERFAHSQELDPKLGRLLNLAFCHEQEGKTASAWNEYNGAAALAEQKGQAERVAFARDHAALVAKKLAFVHLDIPQDAATVEVDGTGLSRDKWPTPLPMDPGDHRVVVAAPEKKTNVSIVTVGTTPGVQDFRIAPLEDERSPEAVAVPTPPSGQAPEQRAAASSDEAAGPRRPNYVPAFVGLGVAVAGLASGSGFGVAAMSKKSAADLDCPQKACNEAGTSLISQARALATVSTIAFGVGIAGGAVATWLFVRPPGAETTSARFVPVVGPRMSGLAMQGSW